MENSPKRAEVLANEHKLNWAAALSQVAILLDLK